MNDGAAPRVAPVDHANLTDAQRTALEPLGPMGSLNIFTTLAVHPKLLASWLPFGGRLLQGSSLTPRVRELVILRTAARCGSRYEWGQHVGIARDAGLTDAEIVACAEPTPGTPHPWGEEDLAVLGATDELLGDHCVTQTTWDRLVGRGWTDPQLLELTMLAGHYAMLAGMLRSAGVQTETALPPIGRAHLDPSVGTDLGDGP